MSGWTARRGQRHALALWLAGLAGLAFATRPLEAAAPPSNKVLAAYADGLFNKAYPAGGPGAAVLILRQGEVVLRKGYGMADLELGVPVRPDHVFWIASITKPFTAVALMQLVERGKVGLDDEITKYLPDYPTHGARITIEELLTHTSGIPTYAEGLTFAQKLKDELSLNQLIGRFKDKELDFTPGTKWSYSDSGYVLLGAVIEKASGRSYAQYVSDEILKPAGMSHSRYGSNDELIPGRVQGYERAADGIRRARYASFSQGYSAGSLVSTVDDLAAFDRALNEGKLLKPETVARMQTPKVLPDGTSTRMGLSWSVTELDGRKLYEHNGGIYGFATHLLRMPEESIVIAVLSNDGDGAPRPETNAFFIAERALGHQIDAASPVQLDAATLASLAGSYTFADKTVRTLAAEGGKIFFQRNGGAKLEVFASGPDELRLVIAPDNRLQLVRDAKGAVTGLRVLPRFGPAGGVGAKAQ